MPPMWLNNFGFVIPDQAVTNGIFAYRLRNGREFNTDDIERLLDPMDLRMIRSPDGNYFTANWTISDLNLTMLAWSLDAFAAGEYPTYYHALVNLFLNEGYHLGEEDTPGPNEVAVCTYAASLVVGFGSGHNVPYNELRLEFNRRATGVIPDTSIMFRKFDGAMERALENSFGFTIPEVLLGLICQIVASDITRNYPKCRTFFHPSEPDEVCYVNERSPSFRQTKNRLSFTIKRRYRYRRRMISLSSRVNRTASHSHDMLCVLEDVLTVLT